MTGATGFVGTNIRASLGHRPMTLLVRKPEAFPALATDMVSVVNGDVTDASGLSEAMAGCDTVIHLVAIIQQSDDATFDGVIRGGTENVVEAAKNAGVRRFINMSALGTSAKPEYSYFFAKWQGEEAVKASGMDWTIFRPSIIFGPGDGFINQLADLVRKAPIMPVVGDGNAKFQPVSVKEVADAFRRAVDDQTTIGKTYELGGPDILTYEQILDIIADELGKKKPKVHVPVGLMKTVLSMTSLLPTSLRPPVSSDQLRMLAVDNCSDNSSTATLIGREQLRLRDGITYIAR